MMKPRFHSIKSSPRGQAVVEFVLILVVVTALSLLVFNYGKSKIIGLWSRFAQKIEGACANCSQ